MKQLIYRLTEPKMDIPGNRKIFSNHDLKILIVPLFLEQLLEVLVGVSDTFMVSYAGEAAVSGVSLVNMFNTVFIYLFSALAAGGAVVVSQYIGSRDKKNADLSAGQLVMAAAVFSAAAMIFSLVWNRQLLRMLFGEVERDVMEACVTYLRISAYSYPAIAVYNAGVAGVAYPSLIARTFSAVVILIFCFRKETGRMRKGDLSRYDQDTTEAEERESRENREGPVRVRLTAGNIFRLDRHMVKRILGIAVPNGIENGLFQLAKVALSSITALFGTVQDTGNSRVRTVTRFI